MSAANDRPRSLVLHRLEAVLGRLSDADLRTTAIDAPPTSRAIEMIHGEAERRGTHL